MSPEQYIIISCLLLAIAMMFLCAWRDKRRRDNWLKIVDPIYPHLMYPNKDRDLHQRCMESVRLADKAPKDDNRYRQRICWCCHNSHKDMYALCTECCKGGAIE